VQPAEGPESPDSYRNKPRQARHDPSIQKDLTARHRADGGKTFRFAILMAAPTEPKVTDVTAASTAAVVVGNHQCIPTWMLVQPMPCLVVEGHFEGVRHLAARRRRR
jgi:hypothetical protein